MVHSIELLFDPDTETAIRRVWQRLSDLSLRSPTQTSRPHVTLVVADTIAADVDPLLSALNARLPLSAIVGAPMVFGHSPLILVRAVVPSTDLLALHAEAWRMCQPYADPAPAPNTAVGQWTPHVTLARRVDPAQLREAFAIRRLSRDVHAEFVGIRHWDGNNRVEHVIR
ncbi:MAG TPA: 2'-5' RNA ligase family protein [Mycobacterium sp.]|nr:2'-5' RNA ligase family protein [Mycobacterium sp.]